MPHYSKLQQNVSEGTEPGQGDCGDQEEHGILSDVFDVLGDIEL